jgi:hypothetical protein
MQHALYVGDPLDGRALVAAVQLLPELDDKTAAKV